MKPRLPPSPTTFARSSSALTRIASLERSWASASVSVEAFTSVPMPPFQSRSTGARRIARMTSVGGSDSSVTPSASRACGESRIDFAVRGKTPPPSEISSRS